LQWKEGERFDMVLGYDEGDKEKDLVEMMRWPWYDSLFF